MPYNLSICPTFRKNYKTLLKKYPLSKKEIDNLVLSLKLNPKGCIYPNLIINNIAKIRIPLKKYKIGRRKGLRLIFWIHKSKQKIVPIYIYKKGRLKKEQNVITKIKENLTPIIEELNQNNSESHL